MSDPSATRVYTTQFWLLCLSSLLFFGSFNMIIPELPAYLTSLGGGAYKGLIISLFTLTAMISRPFSGKLADSIGRKPVIIFGAVVCLVCSLFYPILTSVSGFLLLRLIHGFSTGFTPTGTSTYLSDIIPAHKRGEAMGMMGTAGTIGMAAGPMVGGLVSHQFGLDAMFYCSSLSAVLSIAILFSIRETLAERRPFSIYLLKIRRQDLFEPKVLAACIVMVMASYAYGAVYTVLPDFGQFLGIDNKGILFACLTVASLLIRLIAGKASDVYGRVPVLKVSTIMVVISMLVIATADQALWLMAGVTLYGLAQGSTSSTLLAWATDLSDEHHRGRGLASLYISMEFGIGVGALISGWLYGNETTQFFQVFAVCSVFGAIAFSYLFVRPFLSKA